VADSLNSRIAAIADPLMRTSSDNTGATISSGGSLNDPLAMALAINGNILTVNGDDGFLVETTPSGAQILTTLLDDTGSPPGAGALFGLADVPGLGGRALYEHCGRLTGHPLACIGCSASDDPTPRSPGGALV